MTKSPSAQPPVVQVTQADRRAACRFHGYDDEKDLAYWGNASKHHDVERLAETFARHRQHADAVSVEW